MKLIAENRASFEACIDRGCPPEASTVRRYRHALRFDERPERDAAFKRQLAACSIREGARIVPLLTYRGVEIHLLDETSGMATGSLKAIDGCLTASLCRVEGTRRIAFESGGNTGSALTLYGARSGLETFFFCPRENLDLLDGRLFGGTAHLIAVEGRDRVKELAGLFASEAGIRHVPADTSWRYAAAMFRGLFILEHLFAAGRYDWISQTVSAAFGPIGIYRVLESFRRELGALPRFLGIQQEENCPLYRALKPGAARAAGEVGQASAGLLTRVMYDTAPQTYRTFEDFQLLLERTGGDLLTVNRPEFDGYTGPGAGWGNLLELLGSRGIAVSVRSGEIVEKTGMIALAGTLKAIDAGIIAPGGRVLCSLTSGVSDADGRALPERTVRGAGDVREYLAALAGGA